MSFSSNAGSGLIKRVQQPSSFGGGQHVWGVELDDLSFVGIGLADILANEPATIIVGPNHLNEGRVKIHGVVVRLVISSSQALSGELPRRENLANTMRPALT